MSRDSVSSTFVNTADKRWTTQTIFSDNDTIITTVKSKSTTSVGFFLS